MNKPKFQITHRSDLAVSGFAGIVETVMVKSPTVGGDPTVSKQSTGLDEFVYLAVASVKPHDGAPMHSHRDLDVVSVVLQGRIEHAGTLGDGTVLEGPGVQVQRSGTGMQHEEMNPDATETSLIQLWFLPPKKGLTPAYKDYSLERGRLSTVLGGASENDAMPSTMRCQVGLLEAGQSVQVDEDYVAYLAEGNGTANGERVTIGDLIEGHTLSLVATNEASLLLITRN